MTRLIGIAGRKTKVLSYWRYISYVANLAQLRIQKGNWVKVGRESNKRILFSLIDLKAGLADITRPGSRIKEFMLSDAIVYSYFSNLRFVTALCLIIGGCAFWGMAPCLLFVNPTKAIFPEGGSMIQLVKDTFIDYVCCTHKLSSPCESCNEPLNQIAREWFSPPESKFTYNPLEIDTAEEVAKVQRMKALAISIAIIILGIALAESVSEKGYLVEMVRSTRP